MILSRLTISRSLLLSGFCWGLSGIIGILPSQARDLPATTTIAQALTDSQQQAIIKEAEQYILLISQGKYEDARKLLAPQLQADWTAESLGKLWQRDLIDTAGSFQKIIRSSPIDVINADVVKLTVQFSKRTEDILLTFNKQQQLIAANWSTGKSVDQIVEEFIAALQAGDYAKARTYLNPLLKTEIFPERIKKGWTRVIDRHGDFRKLVDVEVKPAQVLNAPDVAIVTLKFAKGSENFFIFFDRDRSITNIDFPQE